jgi:two-component system, NarL family, invasion response regulator UvrY
VKQENEIRVLLVDDHAVVREGYRRLLERQGDIVVVGEAADATAAYSLFTGLGRQLIVVMDITLPRTSGLETLRRMLTFNPKARILIFSMHEEAIFAKEALGAGAYGYVTKASAPEVLVEAVLSVARGKKYLSPEIAQKLALLGGSPAPRGLTERECDVLRFIAEGRSAQEIADLLQINTKTVANHQAALKQKLEAKTPVDLVRRGKELGVIQ